MHGTLDFAEGARRERALQERVLQDSARDRAFSLPLEDFDPGHPELFRSDAHWPYFDRLRKEDPVHDTKNGMFGPYWSVTKCRAKASLPWTSRGTARSARPWRRLFTPTHLDLLAISIRERSAGCLDNPPRNDVFDWVSIDCTRDQLT
jgi:hypothetical protein